MNNTIPAYTVITANGGQTIGGFELSLALQVAREVEAGSGQPVMRITQGAAVVLEGDELRQALA